MGNYYLYMFAYHALRFLPPRVSYAMARVLADCQYLFSKTDRRIVEENLKAILQTDDVAPAKVRQVFRNFARYLADFFMQTKRIDDNYMKAHMHLVNSEYLNEVLKEGKGAILVSAHMGNWEMGGAIMSKLGYPMSIVALPHRDPRVNQFFNDQREFFGTQVIPTTTAIRRCLEHLKQNRFVGLLAERDFTQHGIVMDFLGRPTLIPKGAALFSIKSGAPILACFFLRQENDDFQIVFHKPVYPPAVTGKVTDAQLVEVIKPYLRPIEEEIRRDPSQWLMFREFWVRP